MSGQHRGERLHRGGVLQRKHQDPGREKEEKTEMENPKDAN